MENLDYWEGFDESAQLSLIEVAKILAGCYNDSRMKAVDCLLDLRNRLSSIKEMGGCKEKTTLSAPASS